MSLCLIENWAHGCSFGVLYFKHRAHRATCKLISSIHYLQSHSRIISCLGDNFHSGVRIFNIHSLPRCTRTQASWTHHRNTRCTATASTHQPTLLASDSAPPVTAVPTEPGLQSHLLSLSAEAECLMSIAVACFVANLIEEDIIKVHYRNLVAHNHEGGGVSATEAGGE